MMLFRNKKLERVLNIHFVVLYTTGFCNSAR